MSSKEQACFMRMNVQGSEDVSEKWHWWRSRQFLFPACECYISAQGKSKGPWFCSRPKESYALEIPES